METNHQHHPERGLRFKMAFRTDTEIIKAGEPVKLFFKPEAANQQGSIVPLALLHEKKIHLIIISRDLSYFAHVHPELSENEEYLYEHTFPSGGPYILFQDYMPEDADQQLGRQEIHVVGDERAKDSANTVAITWKEGEYEVNILPNEPTLKVNADVSLKATVTKKGRPITNLENYLGSLAHVVIISSDTKNYLHVHPMDSATNGPDIMLHTHFPTSGYYKVFMEFKHEGQVRLAIFVLKVGTGK